MFDSINIIGFKKESGSLLSEVSPAVGHARKTNEVKTCTTQTSKAFVSGLKVWCFDDFSDTGTVRGTQNILLSKHLKADTECDTDQVIIHDGEVKFHLDLEADSRQLECEKSTAMRAEIRTVPWKVNHPPGTEEWFGWQYSFDQDYIVDKDFPWLFFQVHEGTWGQTPLIALWCINESGPGSGKAGEIHVVNNSYRTKSYYYPTGVSPVAGEVLNIVVHVIWGDFNEGLLQVWINGKMVCEKKGRTIRESNPVGGNAKWGIYKWKWASSQNRKRSKSQGINSLNTSMRSLRIVTRKPEDQDYLKNAFHMVAPQ